MQRTRRRHPVGPPEPLEGRTLLSTFTWASPVSGDFAVAANWNGPNGTHAVPGSTDDAVTPAGNYTITSQSNETVNSFNGGAKLDVTGRTFGVVNKVVGGGNTPPASTIASLTVALGAEFISDDSPINLVTATTAIDGGSIAGTLVSYGFFSYLTDSVAGMVDLSGVALEAGCTLQTDGGEIVAVSQVSVDGPVTAPESFAVDSGSGVGLTGPGPLTVPTYLSMLWDSGTIATRSIVVNGSLDIAGSGPRTLDGGTLSNAGIVSWTGSGTLNFADGATFDNAVRARFIVFSHDLDVTGGSGGTFDNAGQIFNYAGPTTFAVTFQDTASTDPKTGTPNDLIATYGALTLPGFTNAGEVDLDPGGSLAVSGDYTQAASGRLFDNIGQAPTPGMPTALAVSGQATFGGTLSIVDVDNVVTGNNSVVFTPNAGQVFPLASFASATGSFATTNIGTRGGVPVYALETSATGYTVVAKLIPPSGLSLNVFSPPQGSGTTTLGLPQFVGQADPRSLVQVYDASERLIASGTTFSTGTFVALTISSLSPGTYVLRAVEVDAGGTYSAPSLPFTLTVEPAPPAPTGLTILPADDDGGPGLTTHTTLRLTGKATPGLLVQVYINDGDNLIASGIAGPDGTFVAQVNPALAYGNYALQAVAVNASGNYGENGAPFLLTITPAAPPTGLTLLPADDTGGPGTTAVHAPRLTGMATPGLLVQVYDQNQHLIASARAGLNGVFTAQVQPALTPGSYTLKAVAITASGQYGAVSAPFALTITPPPPAPTGLTLYPADDNQGPGKTSITTPRLTGQAKAGSLVQVYDGSTLIASAVAAGDGTFVTGPSRPLSAGAHTLKAVAADAGGNYGPDGSAFALTVT